LKTVNSGGELRQAGGGRDGEGGMLPHSYSYSREIRENWTKGNRVMR